MATAIQSQAWSKIAAYVPSGAGAAPILAHYRAAGITSVTAVNLAWVNASIIGMTLANSVDADIAKAVGIITSVNKLQALANGALADVAANNLNVTDFANLGITGASSLSGTQLSLVNSLLGAKTIAQLTNKAAVQAVVDATSRVFSATTASPSASLVAGDFAAVGIQGVAANNLEVIKTAISVNGVGKTAITDFQDIVTKASAALSIIVGYANGNAATEVAQTAGNSSYTVPTAAHYAAIGLKDSAGAALSASDVALLNSALATKGVIGTEVNTKAKLEAILTSAKAIVAEVGDIVSATGEPGTDHIDPTFADYQNVGLEDISTVAHANILNSFLDNQRIGDKVKSGSITINGTVVLNNAGTVSDEGVEVFSTPSSLTDLRVLLEEAAIVKKFLAYAAGAENGLSFADLQQLGISTANKDLNTSLANIRAQYVNDGNTFANMDTVAEIQVLLRGLSAHIDRVTSSRLILNMGDQSAAATTAANDGAATFTVHFNKQLANAATALDAAGANFELVLSNGTVLTAGIDFFADVQLDATDTTNQTYTVAVFLLTAVDDAGVTLRYIAKPTAAAAVLDVDGAVTSNHIAFANESDNANITSGAFKQSVDTATPDAAVVLADRAPGTILSSGATGFNLVNGVEIASTSATFILSHAADATKVELFAADGATLLGTANAGNFWSVTVNIATLNPNLDPNTGVGSYQFVTRQTDDAGNVVDNSCALKFDTLVTPPTVTSAIGSTVLKTDFTGSAGSEIFTISGDSQEDGIVTVVWDQSSNGTAEFTRTAVVTGGSSAWSVNFLKSDLITKSGAGQFTVTFRDWAYNTSTATHYATNLDFLAPTATLGAGTSANSGNAMVQSTEPGTAYLVNSTVAVTDVASITNAADANWNQVSLATGNASDIYAMSLAGLVDGSYKLYTVDAAGNLSAASVASFTVDSAPPAFTSAASASVVDTGTGIQTSTVLYTAAASDQSTPITFSLSGVDAGLFDINSSTGAVTFKAAETWASTKDSGADNVYNFNAIATDAAGNAMAQAVDLTMSRDLTSLASSINVFFDAGLTSTAGKLISGIVVDKNKIYYFWDRNGDNVPSGQDYMTHDALDAIFNKDINGNINPAGASADTTDTYRYATLFTSQGAALRVALPTSGTTTLPNGSIAGTAVAGSDLNPTYDGFAAIWDAYNGTGTTIGGSGKPSGWGDGAYHTSTFSSPGSHYSVTVNSGYNSVSAVDSATNSYMTALQVL